MWIEEQKNGKVKYCDRVKDISGKLRMNYIKILP